MLQAYVDDSGSEIGDRKYFLCAYAYYASERAKFAVDWGRALHAQPAIKRLHTVDAWNLSGEFKGWTEAQRNKKLEELGQVIQKYKPFAPQVSVSKTTFEREFKPFAPYHLQNPYCVCFYGRNQPCTRSPGAWRTAAWHVRRHSEKRTEHLPALKYLRGVFAEIEMCEETLRGMAEKIKDVPGVKSIQTRGAWRRLRPSILRSLASGMWPRPRRDNLLHRALKGLARFIRKTLLRGGNKP